MLKVDKGVTRARIRLRQAVDRACIARGEVQWTNGYRCAINAPGPSRAPEEARLYDKEMNQLRICATVEATVERAMRAFARVVRQSRPRPSTGRVSK